MPTIAIFFGITILMHVTRKEHNPPHIHAFYGDFDAPFLISTGEIESGEFPKKQAALVKRFILEYQDELKKMWDTEQYHKLPKIDYDQSN